MGDIEKRIHLDRFIPRLYQRPIFDAIENKGYKRVLAIWPRRAGKDIVSWNLIIRMALKKLGVYYYIFPTYSQAKKVIWDSITNDGMRFRDFIPPSLIQSSNSQEMKVFLTNGSLIQLIGSDHIDAIVGTNPIGCVFSEYALQTPDAYKFLRPILVANDGWALFESTPRGRMNHLYELYQIAQYSPEWFCYKLTLDDTNHISRHVIEKEKAEGLMSEDLILQEYFTSFDLGVEGSYYSRYIDKMRLNGQITTVPWEPSFKVYTAWDLGMRDATSIIFFQSIGTIVRIIDCYENTSQGLEHYAKYLSSKPYDYGKHFAPHDIAVRELGTGVSRLEKSRQLGLHFKIAPKLSIEDGIEAVRSTLSKVWLDDVKCQPLLKALESYRQEYDSKKGCYTGRILHNAASNYCLTKDTLLLTRTGMRPIFKIGNNDEVLTLEGWKKCSQSFMTRKNAPLLEVIFSDGTKVRCTPEHPFLTEKGWKYAEDLSKGTVIQSSLIKQRKSLTEKFSSYLKAQNTSGDMGLPIYTGLSGLALLGIFHPSRISITGMGIHLITIYGILNAYLRKYISKCLSPIIKALAINAEMLQLNGTGLRLVGNGTVNMHSKLNRGLNIKEKQGDVCFVIKNLAASSEKAHLLQNTVTPTVKPLMVEDVKSLKIKEDVWCITVPGVGHFSLSNGAVVKNSDAMRYLCLSLPKTRDGLSSEDIDKNYREAKYGNQSNLPGFFRDDYPKY